jgi:PEP-CTERM motif
MRPIILAMCAPLCTICLLTRLASADPLPDEILKFQQLPLNNGFLPVEPVIPSAFPAPFPGHDELSTATLQTGAGGQRIYQGQYMADDFADKFDTPIVHVRWWGSYLQDFTGNPAAPGVKQFLISFEPDVPANDPNNTTGFSHPGAPGFHQIVDLKTALAPDSGTFTETPIPTPLPAGGVPPREKLFQYNAELNLGKEFRESANNVYWLKIVALVDPTRDGPINWGWHDRDWSIPDPLASTPPAVVPGESNIGSPTFPIWHFQDDAVTGPVNVFVDPSMPRMPLVEQPSWSPTHYISPFDGPEFIQQYSKDLAFELYTRVPEPSSLLLLGLGSFALIAMHRRRTDDARP